MFSIVRKLIPFTAGKVRLPCILSMSLNCGIVGLPNVGKSTLFNALVGSQAAQAANFPFCTIGGSSTLSHVHDFQSDNFRFLQNPMWVW